MALALIDILLKGHPFINVDNWIQIFIYTILGSSYDDCNKDQSSCLDRKLQYIVLNDIVKWSSFHTKTSNNETC